MATMTAPLGTGTVAPPRDTFELGQWITFHHRCGVARYLHIDKERKSLGCEWVITEGCYRQEYAPWKEKVEDDGMLWWTPPPNGVITFNHPQLRWAFGSLPKRRDINKTIMVWPHEGEGIVVGLVRREIGESVRGYTDSFSGEYEPGYFGTESRHWLYVVKQYLAGTQTIFVPMWAARAKETI